MVGTIRPSIPNQHFPLGSEIKGHNFFKLNCPKVYNKIIKSNLHRWHILKKNLGKKMNPNPTRIIKGFRKGHFFVAAFISAKFQLNFGGLSVCIPHRGDVK